MASSHSIECARDARAHGGANECYAGERCGGPKQATDAEVERYARRAYADLDGFPEFGFATREAIIDTAGMLMTDDGLGYSFMNLCIIAQQLAG